jgi:hypothetical protein
MESNGGVPTNVQDQTSRPIDLYFITPDGTPTTTSATSDKGDRTITLTSTSGFTDGQYLGIFQGTGAFYFGTQIGAPVGSVITIDSPLDFDVISGANVVPVSRELNVDGSSTPVVFDIRGPATANGTQMIDITRVIITMFTGTAPTFGTFGDISALTNGVVLRRNNGVTENIWNVKTNGDFASLAYDFTIYTALGVGQDGFACRQTFSGQDKHGVAIRLGSGDMLDFIVQDDLTDLDQFRIIAQGHYVTD